MQKHSNRTALQSQTSGWMIIGLVLLVTAAGGQSVPELGLIAHWPLDDALGCHAIDDASGHEGTLAPACPTNSPQWAAGHIDGALTFDGADDEVQVNSTTALSRFEELTLAAWIRHDPATDWRAIVDKRDAHTDGYDIYIDLDSRFHMRINDQAFSTGATVDDGEWHHVVGTWDGAEMVLYIDGDLDTRRAVTPQILDTANALRIGHHHSEPQHTFDGSIDDVRIYDRALSELEVLALYVLGNATLPDELDFELGLVGLWGMNEGIGCTASSIGPANDADLGPLCPVSSPAWTDGFLSEGSALEFDGFDDRAVVRSSSVIDTFEEMTMSAWVRVNATFAEQTILDKRDSETDGFALYIDDLLRPTVRINETAGTAVRPVAIGEWQHFAATYDGQDLRLYVDGVLELVLASSEGAVETSNHLFFGRTWSGSDDLLQGGLDEVRIYDRALSPVEVLLLFVDDLSEDAEQGVLPGVF